MLHNALRAATAMMAMLGLSGCPDLSANAKPASHSPGASDVSEDGVDWEGLLLEMQEADRIEDDFERCLRYPDVPGLSWSPSLVRARCAFQRPLRYDLEAVSGRIETASGRAELERHFDDLLAAHYAEPDERDQIARAFEIFDERLDARETARRWHALSPDSAYASLAYGLTLLQTSLAARGERSASETPQEDMRRMQDLAGEADRMLSLAYAAEPRLTPACVGRVEVARITGAGEDPFELGRRCAQADRLSYVAVLEWKSAASPRWGGSRSQLQEVAQHALANREANPMMDSVRAAIASDPLVNRQPHAADIEPLQDAARIGPNSLLFNQLSAAWFAQNDHRRGLAYLSQAVRFNIGKSDYRAFRSQFNLFVRPEWAIIDLEYAIKRDRGSPFLQQQLAQARANLLAATAQTMARDGEVTLEGDSAAEWRKAVLFKECEEYGLAGKTSSEVMNRCTESLVNEWPDDAEAWRVRADVLRLREDRGALNAARRYLELADPDAVDYNARAARYSGWLKGE